MEGLFEIELSGVGLVISSVLLFRWSLVGRKDQIFNKISTPSDPCISVDGAFDDFCGFSDSTVKMKSIVRTVALL